MLANKATKPYFHFSGKKKIQGRPTTTLPTTINKDLSGTQDRLINAKIKSGLRPPSLTSAQDRDQRRSINEQITEITEASRSDDQDAKSEEVSK